MQGRSIDLRWLILFGSVLHSYENIPAATQVPKLLDAYFSYVEQLYKDGGRKFLFLNLNPFDRSPPLLAKGANNAASCSAYSKEYNTQLERRVKDWSSNHKDVSFDFPITILSNEGSDKQTF